MAEIIGGAESGGSAGGGGAGGMLGGSLLGGYGQWAGNKNLQEDAQSFTRGMSNSAYQRAMADMRKAGLNPMLAYSMGGESTPGGGGGSSISAPDLVGAISSAKQMERTDADINTAMTQQALNAANTGRAAADTAVSLKQADRVQADIDLIRQQTRSATAKGYMDEEDARMRKDIGPKNDVRDAIETGTKILQKVKTKLGQFNVTPNISAGRGRPTDVGRRWSPGSVGDPNPGGEMDVFAR